MLLSHLLIYSLYPRFLGKFGDPEISFPVMIMRLIFSLFVGLKILHYIVLKGICMDVGTENKF